MAFSVDLPVTTRTRLVVEAGVSIGGITVTRLDPVYQVQIPHVVRGTLGNGDGRIDLQTGVGSIAIMGPVNPVKLRAND